ncbi:unnamed protein product [Calypogeia fissa]
MTTRSFSRSEREEDERLLPELPDEIVLGHVVPKLPWQAFPVLSLVSRRWREANQSRCMYDARVRSHSTETVFVLSHGDKYEYGDHAMSLYSMRANPWLRRPPFPKSWGYKCSIPRFHHCLSFDGKNYLLGRFPGDGIDDEQYSEVFMLDLAGQREWKRCADLPQPRTYFGCGVAEGKIYVIGGAPVEKRLRQQFCECFVYDPRANTWSQIRPMKQAFLVHRVFGVGKELSVMHCPEDHPAGLEVEVYHVDKDEWRCLGPWQKSLDEDECAMLKPWTFSTDLAQKMFSANGKLHMATPFGIYIYSGGSDGNLKLSTRLHSYWGFE